MGLLIFCGEKSFFASFAKPEGKERAEIGFLKREQEVRELTLYELLLVIDASSRSSQSLGLEERKNQNIHHEKTSRILGRF